MNKKFHILHLDDTLDFTKKMEAYFTAKMADIFYEIVFTTDDADKKLHNKLPDLFIVDLMLHDEHDATPGVEYIKKIKPEYPDLKIMVLSDRTEFKDELDNYIEFYEDKAFRPSDLQNKISQFIENINNKTL